MCELNFELVNVVESELSQHWSCGLVMLLDITERGNLSVGSEGCKSKICGIYAE